MFTIEQRKWLFAEQFVATPREIYKAGMAAWPDNPNQGLALALEWANDPDVIKYCGELRNSGVSPNIPQKEELVKELLEIGRNIRSEAADRIKAFELAAKILGYIVPAQTNIKHTSIVDSRVMVVRDHGDPDQWEQRAKIQQRKLIEGHATTSDNDEMPASRYQ